MISSYLLIYHKEDNDGVFSAAIAKDYLMNELHIPRSYITLMGCTYDDLNNLSNGDVEGICDYYTFVIMMDISFSNPKRMKKMADKLGQNLYWIDHHKPAIENSYKYHYDNLPGVRDTSTSAMALTYMFLKGEMDKNRLPELIKILASYDSWTYEENGYTLDYVNKINKAVTLCSKLDVETVSGWFGKLDQTNISEFESMGSILVEYDKVRHKKLIDDCGDLEFKVDGKLACALFIQGPSNSIMFESIADGVDHGIVFKYNVNGKWTVSLYNTRNDVDFDCGAYLRDKYKGGGHKGAAGCIVPASTFNKIMRTKSL